MQCRCGPVTPQQIEAGFDGGGSQYRPSSHGAALRSCLELDGKDLRWQAIEHRKSALAKLIRGVPMGLPATSISPATARHLSARLCTRLRGHRLKAAWVAPSVRPGRSSAQGEESSRPAGNQEAEEDWGTKRWELLALKLWIPRGLACQKAWPLVQSMKSRPVVGDARSRLARMVLWARDRSATYRLLSEEEIRVAG